MTMTPIHNTMAHMNERRRRPCSHGFAVMALVGVSFVSLLQSNQMSQGFNDCWIFARELKNSVQDENMVVPVLRISKQAVSFFDKTALKEMVKKNVLFHCQGGNLKSVQLLKDKSIDTTLQKQAIKFIPEGSSEGIWELTAHLKQHYEKNYDPRGGYGRPLPGKLTPSPVLSGNRWFDVIEPREGRHRWDAALGPIGPTCSNLIQLGNKGGDGYKFMCLPDNSTAAMNSNNECHIISVGGNDNWRFEVAAADKLGCIIHTFDCTLPKGIPKHKPQRDDIRFYNYCIDGESRSDSHGRQYLTYGDMLKTAGIQKPPAYFKLDVEGFEYDIFTEMMQSPDLLPRQIQVELHWGTRMTGLSWMPRLRTSGEIALMAGMMFHGGFLPVHLDFNPYCTPCMEVLYFRALE